MGRLPRVLLAALVIVPVACGGPVASPAPAAPTDPPVTEGPPATEEPTATPDLVTSLATGAWRRKPVGAPLGFVSEIEAACRAALPTTRTQPLAVTDLRGEHLATLVFGDMATGSACWATLDAPDTPVEARELTFEPGAPDGIDVVLYEPVEAGGTVRTFLIGRVGPMSEPRPVLGDQNIAQVIAGFDNETFVWGAFANGWYAMWWPGNDHTDGVAATNGRNEVLDSANPAPPP